MESLYNQGPWSQPLSPELSSPVYSPHASAHSPLSTVSAHSPVLSHAGSPPAGAIGCCSPVSAHSPSMQAAHSPIMHGSPVDMLSSVKQEQFDELRYNSNCDDSLSSLLRNNELIAAQNMAMAPPHMGPPHPREILDGKSPIPLCYPNLWLTTHSAIQCRIWVRPQDLISYVYCHMLFGGWEISLAGISCQNSLFFPLLLQYRHTVDSSMTHALTLSTCKPWD